MEYKGCHYHIFLHGNPMTSIVSEAPAPNQGLVCISGTFMDGQSGALSHSHKGQTAMVL